MFKNVLSNSMLEKMDVWKGKSRSLLLQVWFPDKQPQPHLGAGRKQPWALPYAHRTESAFQQHPPIIHTGPEAFCLRPSAPCQILAKVPTLLLSFPGIPICWSGSLLLSATSSSDM